MSFTVNTMPWLPSAPPDYKLKCRQFEAGTPDVGPRLITLATHSLNSSQSIAFAKALRRAQDADCDLSPLSSFRLAILPSYTTETIADTVPAGCARHGVAVDVAIAEFDQIVQTVCDPASRLFQPTPDAALLLFDHRWVGLDSFAHNDDAIDIAIDRIAACLDRLHNQIGTQAILSTVAVPPGSLFGSLDRIVQGSIRSKVDRFNRALVALAESKGAVIFDVAALAEQVGTAQWFDPVAWNAYKIPFSPSCSALFGDSLGRLIGSMRGRARKCLVLDCDNTLWGGVIGDDGLENIIVGSGSATGESFSAVQKLALDLKARGILLAVCSKNEDSNARLPFSQHPDMLLRESDIAVFQANWVDKPANLEAIARTLEIGLDALVFLDDNSAERAQVRAALPMVAVPELPSDPAYYPLYLSSAGYFEALSFSDEDRKRGESYLANALRAEVREQSRDLGDYLKALEMHIEMRPFDALGRQRIVQLINKSNQFNLTTRRYTEAEITSLIENPEIVTAQVRLNDKFSDFGMIGVWIVRPSERDLTGWYVDTWLMSCRVLGRKVEDAMLHALVVAAKEAGKTTIYAQYLRTAKNTMVADLLDRLGFTRVNESSNGDCNYQLDVATFENQPLPHNIASND